MARAGTPFDFDLNEPPPPSEDDAASPDPAREPPSPQDHQSSPPPPSSERDPSPDLDLDVSLSPLYDEDEDDDDDLLQPAPGPPGLLPPDQAEPSRSSLSNGEGASEDGTCRLPDSPSRLGERTSTSRARSRGRSETTTSSRRSRHGRPAYYVPRDDGGDAASCQEKSDRAGAASPRRYEEQAGGRLAPATMNGEFGEQRQRLKNRRRRRRRLRPYDVNRNEDQAQDQTMMTQVYHHRGRRKMTHGNKNNDGGQDQRTQGYHHHHHHHYHRGREKPQGFRGQKNGAPHGNAPPDFPSRRHGRSSSKYRRLYSRLHGRDDTAKNGVQEPPSSTGGYYDQHSWEAHGRDQQGCHGRRRKTPARDKQRPKTAGGGYRQHGISSRETPPPPPPRAHAYGGREEGSSYGGRPNPAARERGLDVADDEGRYHQQTQTEQAPRRGRAPPRAPVRPYHPYYYPYAPDAENRAGRHELEHCYQHRRDDVDARTRDRRADRIRRPCRSEV